MFNFKPLSLCVLMFLGCTEQREVAPDTARRMVSYRNIGLAYLEENKLQEAVEEFEQLTAIAPEEPLASANIGLAYLRMGKPEQAEEFLKAALNLQSDHPDIRLLLALAYELSQKQSQAIETLQRTLETHSEHIGTLFRLAQYYHASEDKKLLAQAVAHLGQVVNALPANVVVRMQLVELLLQDGQADHALQHMELIRQMLPKLPEDSKAVFEHSLQLMRNNDPQAALRPARSFHNLLKSTSFYHAAMSELRGSAPGVMGEPIKRFSLDVIASVYEKSGIPNTLTFVDVTAGSGLDAIAGQAQHLDAAGESIPLTFVHGDFDGDGDQDLFISRWLNRQRRSRQYLYVNDNGSFEDRARESGILHDGRDLSAQCFDFDNDGYIDLFVTNSTANRLYHNLGDLTFGEVADKAGLASPSGNSAVVAADLDLEGDLDLFVASVSNNHLYRNNSDGTFVEIGEETGIREQNVTSNDAAFGDFDDDGDIDLLTLTQSGENRYYDNLRQGYFRDITEQIGIESGIESAALAVGDYDNDGYLDLFITTLNAEPHLLYRNTGSGVFERDDRSDSLFATAARSAGRDALFFDADNDGALDLLVAGISTEENGRGLHLLYNTSGGEFVDASTLLPKLSGTLVTAFDYDQDGDLDILAAGVQGGVHLLRNDGGNINNYLVVRLAGMRTGSAKNNYFGIGAKVEVKAGTLYQMRHMTKPVAHFGLGNREGADVVRVVWSNGVPQNRFKPERNQTIVEDQILKGSCPWLFAWNGREYHFLTDVLWSSALGMPLGIMGKEMGYAFPNSSNDYLKLAGNVILPKEGIFSLQFTSELWEASYVDRIRLLAVDHPDSLDIYIDERFTPPPYPPFRIYSVAEKKHPLSATTTAGHDVLDKIAAVDGAYVSDFVPGKYQGMIEPHDLILNLGDLSPSDSVFLFLHGWVFPTDASINVNMSQSAMYSSVFPYLQVPDRSGEWRTVIENLGFPKGKNKTVIADLSGKFLADDYRVRIRTNMQIYWDHIFFSTRAYEPSLISSGLELVRADLHYRGFSGISRKGPYSPHIPDYRTITRQQKWRDLTGLYTRYGDVLPLLISSDSKYVIMNAGDELTLEFDARHLPALEDGWQRDFLFYNDGWVKDGDLNTAYGQTVGPLPFHGMQSYPYSPSEAYPDSEEYLDYRKIYNTRKVDTEKFKRFIFNFGKTDK